MAIAGTLQETKDESRPFVLSPSYKVHVKGISKIVY